MCVSPRDGRQRSNDDGSSSCLSLCGAGAVQAGLGLSAGRTLALPPGPQESVQAAGLWTHSAFRVGGA